MGYGFLFDWVDVAGDYFAVDVEPEFSVGVSADSAEAYLSFRDVAVSGAGRAPNPAARELLVECCLLAYSQGSRPILPERLRESKFI